ncbi:MAG: hypothetical protein DVB26_04135, partial [Verrucomicrobia bacterium]
MKIYSSLVSHYSAAKYTSRHNPRETPSQPPSGGTRWQRVSNAWRSALLVGCIGISWQPALCRAQQAGEDPQDAQVLTRGPVHEAFAGVVTFNPEPGVVVPKAAPEAIEEVPPAERPEGANVTWIPGYWAWDDERNDFLWVSGIWRSLPPGRQWIAGYWAQVADGYQWTSGYWADATAQETTYLPAPPATVESGPNIAAPAENYGWTPGCWLWRQQRYAWQPGYWAAGRANWSWMPAHYVWSPRGYVFVDGYWDYPVARRGVMFAPVLFGAGVYGRPGYSYSPTIAIDLALFAEQLFLRPSYHHYYFGDYYAPSYHQGGFVAAYSYQSSRVGYDPIFAHQRWEHRQDSSWAQNVADTYQYRRDHENARPPRTWAALQTLQANPAEAKLNRAVMATPLDQLAKRKDGPLQFQAVPQQDRQKLALRSQEVQKSREQRRTLEAKGSVASVVQPGAAPQPATVKLTKSPIVGKAPAKLKQSEMPPAVPRTPKTDLKILPNSASPAHQPGLEPSVPGLSPREKVLPMSPKTDVLPREKVAPSVPYEKVVPSVPRDKMAQPVPREKVAPSVPREKVAPPVPRERVAPPVPREKVAPPAPREKVAPPAPRERVAPPVPRERV